MSKWAWRLFGALTVALWVIILLSAWYVATNT